MGCVLQHLIPEVTDVTLGNYVGVIPTAMFAGRFFGRLGHISGICLSALIGNTLISVRSSVCMYVCLYPKCMYVCIQNAAMCVLQCTTRYF